MRKIPYTYSIIKYLHDPAAGEMLNVGVLLCSPTLSFVDARFNHHYERLSKAFAGFDGNHYREMITQIEFSVSRLQRWQSPTLFVMDSEFASVDDVISRIMPDRGLSIQFGVTLGGITDGPEEELVRIFERAVISQYPSPYEARHDDEDIWRIYRRPIVERKIDKYLRPKELVGSGGFEYKFQHAFKNENWHVLRPVNLEYARPSGIQERATKLLGEATALSDNRELGTYYFLLGRPTSESHRSAYIKAKNLLNSAPVTKEIIEEDAAEDFAVHLANYMAEHNVELQIL